MILSYYDLAGTYRAVANILGISKSTVGNRMQQIKRNQALNLPITHKPARKKKPSKMDPYKTRVKQLVEKTAGDVQSKKVYEILVEEYAEFDASRRTVDRCVKEIKAQYKIDNPPRAFMPVTPVKGEWLQYDFGDGPVIDGIKTVLFVAWMPWSKARFVCPLPDRKMGSVQYAIDAAFRFFGGVPKHVLTDNEKTVTIGKAFGEPVYNPQMVEFLAGYGCQIHACRPRDPQSKGGVERAVRYVKDEICPSQRNLLPEYKTFADLAHACDRFNLKDLSRQREKGVTVAEKLTEEQSVLYPVPADNQALTGEPRKVDKATSVIRLKNVSYSVPVQWRGETVYAHADLAKNRVIIKALKPDNTLTTIATHPIPQDGNDMVIDPNHYPDDHPRGPLDREIRPTTKREKAFFDIGFNALYYGKAISKLRAADRVARVEHVIEMARLYGNEHVNEVLGVAVESNRLTIDDLGRVHNGFKAGVIKGCGSNAITATPTGGKALSQGTSSWLPSREGGDR